MKIENTKKNDENPVKEVYIEKRMIKRKSRRDLRTNWIKDSKFTFL